MATTETRTTSRVVGTSVPRKEDQKLVTGHGQFIDNINLPGQLWLSVVRSPYAHATIKRVELKAARELEGVVAAFSGAELAADWAGSLPCAWPVTEEIRMPSHFPLAFDKARHVGDGVAVVVADSREIAKDAAELVEVEYEPLESVTDVGRALDADAPLVHDDFETNECYVWKLDAGEVEQAFADAEVTVKRNYRQQRLIPVAMEPRGALAHEMPGTDELTLWTSTQIPHIVRLTLSGVVGVPEARLRVIAPDVGGGFGSKLDVYAEEALVPRAGPASEETHQVDRGALRGIQRDHPRPRRPSGDRARRDRGGEDHRRPGAARLRDGRLPAARDARDPAARCLGLRRLLRHPRLQLRMHRRLHAYDADRRLPRRGTAGGDVCDRTGSRRARDRARDGSGRAAAAQLHHGVPGDDRVRAHDRLRRLQRVARPRARASRSRCRCVPSRPSGAHAATRRSWASGSRPTSRCAGSPRRESSERSATSRAAGTRPRSAACRAAPCRCSPARRRTGKGTRRRGRRSPPTSSATASTRSRYCTATRRSARSGWTRTAAAASPSAGSRSTRRRRRSSPRRARWRHTSWRCPRTTSTTRTARSRPATSRRR